MLAPSNPDGEPSGHPLTPLLTPRTIAVVGASARERSPGRVTLTQALMEAPVGTVFPVNPNQDEILGVPCYPSLADLPAPMDMAILSVRNDMVEAQLAAAIAAGTRAAVIYGSCYLPNDGESRLVTRLAAMAREAGVPICGGNCMGFCHPEAGVRATWWEAGELEPGGITVISHSGSAFISLITLDPRTRYNLVVSAGQEVTTTAADYLDYALELPSTRVVGLFLETVRDPEAFLAGLEKAAARGVPVVTLKVGRTAESARLAESHSGALAGNDAAYEAVFERYGVLRVETMDEFAATLLLLEAPKRPGPGGLAAVLDSGGYRGQLVDLADDAGVTFAKISDATTGILASRLEYGLEPINPLDVWGSGRDYLGVFRACMQALVDDPDTAMAFLLNDISPSDTIGQEFCEIFREIDRATDKPLAVGMHWSRVTAPDFVLELTRKGVPVLDGLQNVLGAVKHAFAYRDFQDRPPASAPPPPAEAVIARWRARLTGPDALDEAEALALLGEFGVPTLPAQVVESEADALAAAAEIGFPVALKTAAPGIKHKSDVGGVVLGLGDAAALRAAYGDIAGRLGPRVLVSKMAQPGVEMALGIVRDAQFGPLLMVGAGGVLIELMRDRRFVLPPADGAAARRAIDALASRPLLDGMRGAPAVDVESLAEALARLSLVATHLGDLLAEVDINPMLVTQEGCMALDALVIAS